MAYEFLRPTKYKLIAFIFISLVLYFVPIVPITLAGPGTAAEYGWKVMPASDMKFKLELEGATMHSFGLFSGTEAGVLNILYVLMVGYIGACLLLFVIHKVRG
ncbi:MAG: hypothetical protein J7K54_04085 [Candidatus Aenigmarchaeota archaeon]|nr:hypothetical protein [Candidatus Aenigmarchaeota archaeon]